MHLCFWGTAFFIDRQWIQTLLTCCFWRQQQPEAKCTEPELYKYYWHTCIHAVSFLCLSCLRVYCPSSPFLLLLSLLLLFTVSAERDWAGIRYTGWLWHENYFIEMRLPLRWGKKKAVIQAIGSPCGIHLSLYSCIYTPGDSPPHPTMFSKGTLQQQLKRINVTWKQPPPPKKKGINSN